MHDKAEIMHLRAIIVSCVIAAAVVFPQALPGQGFDVASMKPSRIARAGAEGRGREKITFTSKFIPTSVIIENAVVS